MSSDNEFVRNLIKGALTANFNDLIKSLPTPPVVPDNDEPSKDDKAKKEEKAFDKPTDDENEEIEVLAYWSLEYRRKSDNLKLQKSQEEITRIICENDELRAKTKNNHAVARGRRIDNRLRLQMAAATFKFMQYWCAFVALIVFIYVAKMDGKPEKEVIIALLGTSTISIVGLVGFVVSGLFKSSKDKES